MEKYTFTYQLFIDNTFICYAEITEYLDNWQLKAKIEQGQIHNVPPERIHICETIK